MNMLMKALKTFRVSDLNRVVSPGGEFEASPANARHYEASGMAVPVHEVAAVERKTFVTDVVLSDAQRQAVKEAKEPPRPTQAGGPTGEATSSSSSAQAPAPRKRRSTKRAAKHES